MSGNDSAKKYGQSLDDFMNHSTRGGGGGAYLSSWKKAGSITVWLHAKLWSAPLWFHGVPRVVELGGKDGGDKRMVAIPQRWPCHENEETIKRQYFRDKEGNRDYPPEVCPACKLIEAVRHLYRTEKIGWTDPVFEWKGDTRDDSIVIHAGGIDGSFGEKDISQAKLRELRVAEIKRTDCWRENLRTKLNYLFLVVDDGDVEAGVQKTFEAKGLGEKLKKAVRDEIKRARTRQDPEGREGNPTLCPYPFEWTFDEAASFDDKYDVLAKTKERPSDEITKLITGDPPDIERDMAPGNCFNLRHGLESHCVLPKGLLDFDAIFEAAQKRGLMVPPEETKEDRDAEPSETRAPEVRGAEKKQEPRVVRIDPGDEAWKDPGKWKPPSGIKGAAVHLNPPEGWADEKINAAIAEIKKAAKAAGALEVAEVVSCEHCGEAMTNLDVACPSCGAEVDEKGVLTSRPCVAEGCDAQVSLDGSEPKKICPKCATIHETQGDDWKALPKEAAKAPEAAPARGRRRATGGGVPFDQKPG